MAQVFVLFLDFDGVLNNDSFLRWQRNHSSVNEIFDPQNIEAFNLLCTHNKISKIIVSSSWKINRSTEDLKKLMLSGGFNYSHLIEGKTENISSDHSGRSQEINTG